VLRSYTQLAQAAQAAGEPRDMLKGLNDLTRGLAKDAHMDANFDGMVKTMLKVQKDVSRDFF